MPSKLENLERAVASMSAIYDYEEPYGDVELAGIVALFEVTFELSREAMNWSRQATACYTCVCSHPSQRSAFAC